jgi:hypothetical protein
LDPDPLYEERESAEQIYKQKVYLRQLQPPTPQPLEIQVQEVLIKPQVQQFMFVLVNANLELHHQLLLKLRHHNLHHLNQINRLFTINMFHHQNNYRNRLQLLFYSNKIL